MNQTQLTELAERFLGAWSSQSVEAVLACYTDDLVYVDPNTRGAVEGADAMRRYLTKLFGAWEMHWWLREGLPLLDEEGAAVLWRASFQRANGEQTVEVDGMDLVLMEGGRIKRNEVYFDRAALAPLLESQPSTAAPGKATGERRDRNSLPSVS
jgi:ketosteroid isomerase-like protein